MTLFCLRQEDGYKFSSENLFTSQIFYRKELSLCHRQGASCNGSQPLASSFSNDNVQIWELLQGSYFLIT